MSNVKPNAKRRWWCFTINNPTKYDLEQLNTLCADVLYLTYGVETGEKEDTPHYQGYVELSAPQRFSWIKKRLSRAHLEPRKGSRTQARDYCHKEDPEPFEYGTWIEDRQGRRNDLVAIKRKIDEGATELDIFDEHFGSAIRYNRSFNRYRYLRFKYTATPVKVYWIIGEAGSGKSRAAYQRYPRAFRKRNSKWWDGYDGEKVVIWDDYRKTDDYTYEDLLQWLDCYPKSGECKGSTMALTYDTVVFTSDTHPMHRIGQYDMQLARRIELVSITQFTSSQVSQTEGTEEKKESI